MFVPWLLTAELKEHHLSVACDLFECAETGEVVFKHVVTWVYGCDQKINNMTLEKIFITVVQEGMPSLMQDRGDANCFVESTRYCALL
jgi:hypothetical protein